MDGSTNEALTELMKLFNVSNRSQAIRSAIALAGAVAPTVRANTVVVRDQNDNSDLRIILAK